MQDEEVMAPITLDKARMKRMDTVASVIINGTNYPYQGKLWCGSAIEEDCKEFSKFKCLNESNKNRELIESINECDRPEFKMASDIITREAIACNRTDSYEI